MILFPAEFSKSASKYINKLEENPFPQEVERVEDFEGEKVFRVRVGDKRILYVVRYNPNKLIVVKVDKRSRVYD